MFTLIINLLFSTEARPDGTICTLLFPTENGDYSGDCAGSVGHHSSHNRFVSGIEEMSYE